MEIDFYNPEFLCYDPRGGVGAPAQSNFRGCRKVYDDYRRYATLALSDYNIKTNSDYRFVDLEKAGWIHVCGGSMYYITFQARTSEDLDTFYASVFADSIRRVERSVDTLRVSHIRIERPESAWYDGTLCEMAYSKTSRQYQKRKKKNSRTPRISQTSSTAPLLPQIHLLAWHQRRRRSGARERKSTELKSADLH